MKHVAAICGVLIDHGVQFVIIGGMAARLHDTGHATIDVDICPSTDDANLARLVSASADLGARRSGCQATCSRLQFAPDVQACGVGGWNGQRSGSHCARAGRSDDA